MNEKKSVSDTKEDIEKASEESGAKETLDKLAETMRKKK